MTRAAPVLVLALLVPLAGCVDAGALFSQGPDLPTALVRAGPYQDLVVEIDHVAGREPCASTVQAVQTHLAFVTDKRRVRVSTGTLEPQGGDYQNSGLVTIHKLNADDGPTSRRDHGRGDEAHLHILFLDGVAPSANGGHAAGRTIYDYGAIYVFPDAFSHTYTYENGLKRSAKCDVERTVVLHELGHALGIVNRGVPMLTDRESADHPGHSTNPDSVMYPLVRFGSDGRVNDLPSGFDGADLADLAAFRDR